MTLPELMAVLTIGALGVGVTAPALSSGLHSWKLTAAARDMVMEMNRARAEAVRHGAYAGILYERAPSGDRWRLYLDGGSRGIHASEIAGGIDTPMGPYFELADRYPGVRLGIAAGGAPRIPPSSGFLSPADDPIAFGGSDIFSASPTGETSSGTLYLTDGEGMRGVVAFGATGRIRVWALQPGTGQWRP